MADMYRIKKLAMGRQDMFILRRAFLQVRGSWKWAMFSCRGDLYNHAAEIDNRHGMVPPIG
jgi:hypothetical protein